MAKTDWLKKRFYTHFSIKLVGEQQIKDVRNLVRNREFVSRYAFYPLIHKTFKERKFKRTVNNHGNTFRAHKYINEEGSLISNEKEREIFYTNHLDSHIYSYYAQEVLGKRYEEELNKIGKSFSDSICAYRRILIDGTDKGKSNVHFAKEAFDFINQIGNCSVLLFDIKRFFDSLDHKVLKRAWRELIKESTLPDDHYNIFKSVTRFKYVELQDIYKILDIKSDKCLRRKELQSFFKSGEEFRQKLIYKGKVKSNPFKKGKEIIGIPQGTPISAFLANLYLLHFDNAVYNLISSKRFGLYRRYSDDIMIICPKEDVTEIKDFVSSEMLKNKLEIQTAKTEMYDCQKVSSEIIIDNIDELGIVKSNAIIKYLGFEYDGQHVAIKASSLSKFYRELKTEIKAKFHWAKKGILNERKRGIRYSSIHRSKLYRRFSHLANSIKKRNYYNYGSKADVVMNGKQKVIIKKQLKRHFVILDETINKYEHQLNEIGDKRYLNYLRKLVKNAK